jgi:hypothetical protein
VAVEVEFILLVVLLLVQIQQEVLVGQVVAVELLIMLQILQIKDQEEQVIHLQ